MSLGSTVPSFQASIALRAYANPIGSTQSNVLNYMSADALTAKATAVLAVVVPAAQTNYEIDLPTLFAAYDAPIFLSISEVTNPGLGFKITTATNATGKMGVAANGFWAYYADGATDLVSVFVDNADADVDLVLSVGVMAI